MNSDLIAKGDLLHAVDGADRRHFVAELSTGYLSLSRHRQYFRGYCFFSCNINVREVHDLPVDVRLRHLLEMTIVTQAVQQAFNAKKMNVACFGNALPLVHWNIVPRYGNDPLPEDAIWSIDRAVIESVEPSDAELASLRTTLQEVLLPLAKRHDVPVSFDWDDSR